MAEESGPRAIAKRKIGPLPVWGYAVVLVGALLVWRFYSGRGKVSEGEGEAEALGPSSELAGPISPEMVIINPTPNVSVTIPSAPPLGSTTPPAGVPKPPLGSYVKTTKAGIQGLYEVAAKYKKDSRALWGHPANKAVKDRYQGDAHKLKKGDAIFVPGVYAK